MQRYLAHEKVRFVLVGACNTALDFILFNLFIVVLGLPVIAANSLSVVICITISYFMNHYFVFRQQQPVQVRTYLMFVCITGFSSIVIQGCVIWLFVTITRSEFTHSVFLAGNTVVRHDVALNVAKVIAVLTGMVWNFLLYKYVVFRRPQISLIDNVLAPDRLSE